MIENNLIAIGAIEMKYTIPKQARGGATLVEILMSLMVMSIGLVSVAAIFPISMMRSMQSTQLTSAAFLNYQCEDMFRAFPRMAINHFSAGNILPYPEFKINSPMLGRYASSEHNADSMRNIRPKYVVVIDPIGASFLSDSHFGKDLFGLHSHPHMFQAVRSNAGFNLANVAQRKLAYTTFSSNDSWSQSLTSNEVIHVTSSFPAPPPPANSTVLRLIDTNTADLAALGSSIGNETPVGSGIFEIDEMGTSKVAGRVIVISSTLKQSFVADLLAVNSIEKTVILRNALPNNGLFNAIPEVRLELFEPRYTCIVTVRRQLMGFGIDNLPGDGGDPDNLSLTGSTADDNPNKDEINTLGADLVVFYRRDFSPQAEQAYRVENLNKGTGGLQSAKITVEWTIPAGLTNEDVRPKVKAGNYVFDPWNGYWYSIQTVLTEDRDVGGGRHIAEIILQGTIQADGKYLIFPERVVEVVSFSLNQN